MERISGIKISDIAALDRAGVDRSEMAQRFYAAYLKQWFLDGVFHADHIRAICSCASMGHRRIKPMASSPARPVR